LENDDKVMNLEGKTWDLWLFLPSFIFKHIITTTIIWEFFLSFLSPLGSSFISLLSSFSIITSFSEMDSKNESYVMCIVSSTSGDAVFVKLHDGQTISSLKMEMSNSLDLPVLTWFLLNTYKQA